MNFTWEMMAQKRTIPWFDCVDSASNPVDGLSRDVKKAQGMTSATVFFQ